MDLKVSIIQTKLLWEDPAGNLDLLEGKIEAIQVPTDIVVLPEMFSTGFSMNASALSQSMDGSSVQWMARMAARKNAVITGSLIIKENGHYFNRLIWMQPDGVSFFYNKRHLFRLGEENNHYTAGDQRLIVHWKGWKICPLICYDLRFPVWSRNRFINGVHDFDMLIYVANWPEKRSWAWKSLLVARAIENQAFVVGVNRIGVDGNEINHSGDSGVIDYLGERISRTERFGDKNETVEVSLLDLYQFRKNFPFQDDGDLFEIKI